MEESQPGKPMNADQEPNPRNKGRIFAAGVCFYQDKQGMQRLLESLKDTVDYIFCIDGRFAKYGEEGKDPDLSTDGSRELIESYPNAILFDKANCFEVEKREVYLQACRDYNVDYLLILDSDEYLINDIGATDWDKFIDNAITLCESPLYEKNHIFGVDVEINNRNYVDTIHRISNRKKPFIQPRPFERRQFQQLPRLWHRPGEMKYNGKHYYFHDRDLQKDASRIQSEITAWTVKFIAIGHDHAFNMNNEEHQEKRFNYQKDLVYFESHCVETYFNKEGKIDISSDQLKDLKQWQEDYIKQEELKKAKKLIQTPLAKSASNKTKIG